MRYQISDLTCADCTRPATVKVQAGSGDLFGLYCKPCGFARLRNLEGRPAPYPHGFNPGRIAGRAERIRAFWG